MQNREQSDPFCRLYNHGRIQKSILDLKREFVNQAEASEMEKSFKPKICKKSEKMINAAYEAKPVADILYQDFQRRQKNQKLKLEENEQNIKQQ